MMENINTSENESLQSSSSAAVSTTEPTSMKPENGQSKTVSPSQKVSNITLKRPYGSMPNLTATDLTTGGDATAIVQTPTTVTVQPVSTESIAFDPTPIELANNAGPQIHELPNINTSENESSQFSSSAAVSTTEPTSMKPENGQSKIVSPSQKVSNMTLKRPYGSMPNLTATDLTTGGDATAIVQTSTAVTVEPVSTESIAFDPTPIELANNAGPQIHELPNINTSENESSQSSSSTAVSLTEPTSIKPQDGQSKAVLASRHLSGMTIKRPYGSMPNLTATALTTGGDATAIVQTPTAVTAQPVSTEPIAFDPTPIKLANNAGPRNHKLPAAEVEIRFPSISSAAEPNRDGPGESDAKSRDLSGIQKRLWCSLPNIALHYTDKAFYDTEIERTAPMKVSRDSSTAIEPEVTQVKLKRCSLWKRAKKFARRVFCCAAR